MTTTVETPAPATEAATDEPAQYEYPEGWTFPSYDPVYGEELTPRVVFVNTVRAGNRDSWVGTFRHAEAGRGMDGWSVNGRRVYGAVVNPIPRTGRHYLVFGRFVVRYNDEFNTRLRNHQSLPYSIVCAADGTPWHFPNDGIPSLEGYDYITLSHEVVSNLGQSATAEPETPAVWEDGADTITFGFGRKEEDGTVLLNPAPTIGDTYILWESAKEGERDQHVAHVATYLGGGDINEAFATAGYWYRYYSTPDFQQSNDWHSGVPDRWVKLGWQTDYAGESVYNTVTGTYDRALGRSKKELADFNVETNKLAVKHSWCSEYETIITRLGMKSRYHGYWYAEVKAKLCVTRESVDGYAARDILANLGFSGKIVRNLSMEAEVTFQVRGLQHDTEEGAKELVTEELMTASLAKDYPQMSFSDLTETEVTAIYEDRDAAINAMNRAAHNE
jgi:hypothetical protein